MLRCCTDKSFTRWPRMNTSPPVGISSPAIMRSTVVLPPPLGPSKAINSPSLTENVTLLTAATSPNFLVTPFSSMLIWAINYQLSPTINLSARACFHSRNVLMPSVSSASSASKLATAKAAAADASVAPW